MLPIQSIVLYAVVAGVLAAAVLAALWPWTRRRGRFALAGLTTALGFIAWNLTLDATNATGFLVDAPVIPVSWQDVGSGVLAFAVTALVLGLLAEREERAARVVRAAAMAGLVALILDIFVL
ncbi:MAG: hypothetical protein HY690_00225 [Chloroflexi bacterium]|nr:hypothetical protein [Chloroflexota bacterium]